MNINPRRGRDWMRSMQEVGLNNIFKVTSYADCVTITKTNLSVLFKEMVHFLSDFDRASSLICGNKMTTRCNRGFYCRSYCLLNMFRAPLCPSSGAQEYYTVIAACGISCCGFQVADLVWSWGLCVRFAGCCSILQTDLKTTARNTTGSNHCIILLSSWWWA